MLRLLRIGFLRRWLRANAIRRGLLGGQGPWLAVLALGIVGRQVNKALKRGPMPVVFREELEPGSSLLVTHLPAPPRRRRRRSG